MPPRPRPSHPSNEPSSPGTRVGSRREKQRDGSSGVRGGWRRVREPGRLESQLDGPPTGQPPMEASTSTSTRLRQVPCRSWRERVGWGWGCVRLCGFICVGRRWARRAWMDPRMRMKAARVRAGDGRCRNLRVIVRRRRRVWQCAWNTGTSPARRRGRGYPSARMASACFTTEKWGRGLGGRLQRLVALVGAQQIVHGRAKGVPSLGTRGWS